MQLKFFDAVDRIKNIPNNLFTCRRLPICGFDVKSLFTNIPHKKQLCFETDNSSRRIKGLITFANLVITVEE